MNINEHMNQLGQIGSVGYAPTEAMIDDLLSRTKRARAVRQGSAAVVGSVSAVALGVVGAQIYVAIDHRNDAATQDRNLIENGLPGISDFNSQYGSGYTGIDQKSKEAFEKIYEDLDLAAQIEAKHLAEKQAADAAAAAEAAGTSKDTTTTCEYEERDYNGGIKYRGPETNCQWVFPDEPPDSGVPAGWIEFGGTLGQCKNYTDAASGKTIFAAFIDAGSSWKKIVLCVGGPTDYWSGNYRYVYNGPEGSGWHADVVGTTCTGYVQTVKNAPHRYSCNPNKDYWILADSNYKWFEDHDRYYHKDSPPEGWYWSGTAWVEEIVTPEPTPTATGSA
jgi:hypothetical protein